MRDYYVLIIKSKDGYQFVSSMMLLADAERVCAKTMDEFSTALIDIKFICKQ